MTEPVPSELERLARRLLWWKTLAEAVADRRRFVAQVMALGTWDDLCAARRFFSDEEFRAVLDDPPAGVFDGRSWSYWHWALRGDPSPPPLPRRRLP